MRAIVIEMVVVGPDPNPIWWRGIGSPTPASWAYVFEDFTGEDTAESWALAAAVFVAQTRRRTGQGATFAELFAHLLPETCGLPAPFPRAWSSSNGVVPSRGFVGMWQSSGDAAT